MIHISNRLTANYHKQQNNNQKAYFTKNKLSLTCDTFSKSNNIAFGLKSNYNPRVAIIDSPYNVGEWYDLNGDEINDLPHAQIVERIIQKTHPETETELLATQSIKETLNHLNKIANDMDTGKRTFDAICVPLSSLCHINTLKQQMNIDLTPENLIQNREAVKKHLRSYQNTDGTKPYENVFAVIEAIERITKHHNPIPIFIAGGNYPNHQINLYCFAEGAINVGNLRADGSKKLTNATHSLINRFTQGFFNITEVKNNENQIIGYDVFGNGTIFANTQEVSNSTPYTKKFIGKNTASLFVQKEDEKSYTRKLIRDLVRFKEPFEQFRERLYGRIFDAQKIKEQASELGLESVSYSSKEGDFIPFDHKYVYLKEDQNGILYFDPSGTGKKDAIWFLTGTSFAAPRAVGEYLNERF